MENPTIQKGKKWRLKALSQIIERAFVKYDCITKFFYTFAMCRYIDTRMKLVCIHLQAFCRSMCVFLYLYVLLKVEADICRAKYKKYINV